MSTNLNQYTKVLGEYNTTLKEYREALQRGDFHTINQKYHDLVRTSEELKTEFARIDQGIIDKHNEFLNKEYQTYKELEQLKALHEQNQSEDTLQTINEKSALYYGILGEKESFTIETGIYQFGDEVSRLNKELAEIRIYYNETKSEGDLITLEQRKQNIDVNKQANEINSQYNIAKGEYPQEIQAAQHYTGYLSSSELSTAVLDDHMFYRLITSKQYTNEQFDKIFHEVSENLAKKPITVAEIIKFCEDNGIPHFSDDEFRSLIKNENKDYEDTSRSVRDVSDYNYIAKNSEMAASYQPTSSDPRTNVSTATIVDADSFYKFIDTKMVRGEYTPKQEHKLYVDISEVLVHSPLTKGEINQIYYKHNIIPPTEMEWNRLITRQESRRETDYISKNSDNLKFQGSVDIDVKDQNFKLKVDLYYRNELSNEIKASQNEFEPDIDNIQNILLETTKTFNESFGIRKSGDVANFRIFIFDDAENYLKYSKEARGHATTSDNGNIANVYLFFGDNNYNDDNDLLRHEFAHALTFHATSKLGLSRTFMEGIAEYVVGKMHGKSNADFVKMIPEENFKFSIEHLVKYTPNENDHYVTGAAIIAYLEENHPNFLDNLLYAANDAIKNDRHINVMEMMDKFFQEQGNKPLKEIEWFKESATSNQLNNQQSNEVNSTNDQAYYHSSEGYSGPPAQAKILSKEVKQSETQKLIVPSYIEEFNKRNEKLNEAINKGEVIMFEIIKGSVVSDNKFAAVLQLTEKSREALGINDDKYSNVELDLNRFHIKEVKHGNSTVLRFYDNAKGGTALTTDKALFVLDSSDSNLSGFYLCLDKNELTELPARWISVKNKFNLDSEMHSILYSHLNQQNKLDIDKQVAADEPVYRAQPIIDHTQKIQKQYGNSDSKQFSNKGAELKKAIKEGDVIVYRVKENSNSDGEHLSTTFKMIKKSKEVEANNEYKKGIKLDSKDFDIKKVIHQEGIEEGDKLFYVLYKNDPSKSGFYNLGKEKVGFNTLVKSLEDSKYKCSYHDNIDDKFSTLGQDSHSQQHKVHNEQMQSDQPQVEKVSHSKHHTKHEDIVLKDTILSVGKGKEVILPNGQKIHKAEIKIEYKDIKSLYEKASSTEEQQYILDFYHKLQNNGFKIGDLPKEQYHFKGNKFIIKNKNGTELSKHEGKILLQLMHLKDHQGKDHLELVVLNKADGKVIGNVHEINNLSYGLLRSDSDILSHLEIQGHDITIHSNDYDTYLTHGLDNHILGNHHGGDHTFI